jgi:hypothetical protein
MVGMRHQLSFLLTKTLLLSAVPLTKLNLFRHLTLVINKINIQNNLLQKDSKDLPSPTSTMLATSTLIRRSAPRFAKNVLSQSSKKAFPASASTCVSYDAFYSDSEKHQPTTTAIRYFSAVPAEERRPGSVTKTLRVLNMDVVKQIMEELRSVDVNSDGR